MDEHGTFRYLEIIPENKLGLWRLKLSDILVVYLHLAMLSQKEAACFQVLPSNTSTDVPPTEQHLQNNFCKRYKHSKGLPLEIFIIT